MIKNYYKFICMGCLLLGAYTSFGQDNVIHAHRGFRGLMSENTIQAMINALKYNAQVLEMDISFSKDMIPLVAHDPWIEKGATFECHDGVRTVINRLNLYEMDYADIQKYDVGSIIRSDFPDQQRVKAAISSLSSLIDSVESYAEKHDLRKPWYSIETKTSIARDNKLQPEPEEFVCRLMAVIVNKNIHSRVIIQSFDTRTLEIMHRDFPDVKTMINVKSGSLHENLSRLSFVPTYYAPIPSLIDEQLIEECNRLGITVIGGNTNDKNEIDKLLKLGIKAYMTDFPQVEVN